MGSKPLPKYSGVEAASESSIQITFTYSGQRCRERIKLKPTPANLKRAYNHLCAIKDAIARDTFVYRDTFPDSKKAKEFIEEPGQAITLEVYLEQWLKEQEQILKASTYHEYKKIIRNRLIPALGQINLSDFSKRDAKQFCMSLTCGNKMIANIISPLRKALGDAADDELIESNPLYGWKYRKKEQPKDEHVDPFTAEEQSRILQALSGQEKNLIQFMFWTGLRPSEAIALQWSDIDLKNGVIRVNKATTEATTKAKLVSEVPKTQAGIREVKLLPSAKEALISQKQHTFMLDKNVFLNPRNQEPWIGDRQIRNSVWHPAIRKSGVRYRNPYQTRHTYASMMLSASEHPMWVAKQMGHSDWTMIARVYGKWMPDANPEAGKKAHELFGQKSWQKAGNV